MNDSFSLTALQNMYHLGEESSVFLGGKHAFLYFSTMIKNADITKLKSSIRAVLRHNTLLSCKINTTCIRQEEPVFSFCIRQDGTDQEIAEQLCHPEKSADAIAIIILQHPNQNVSVHFRFYNQMLDGISIFLFLKQLRQHYETGTLPETADFEAYAINQNISPEDRTFFEKIYQSFSAEEFAMPFAVNPEKLRANYCTFRKRQLPIEIYQKLKAIADKNQISLFQLLMSIFGNVTARFSNAEKFYLNIPCTIRPKGTENTIGLYSNFLITPFISDRSKTVIQNAQANAQRFRQIAKHRNFPGDAALKIIRRLDRNTGSVNMIFTAIPPCEDGFVMQDIRFCTNQTALECDFVKLGENYYFTFSSPEGLFLEQVLNSFADMIIDGCIETAHTNGNSKTFPLSAQEIQIIHHANHRTAEFPAVSLNEIIKSAFLRNADKPFMIFQDHIYSYQEILKSAYLLSKKFYSDQTAILLPKGNSQIIALYAVLLFSGAYMPIDISLSADEIQHCLHSTKISQIITNQELSEKLKAIPDIKIIIIDPEESETEDFSAICQKIQPHSPEDVRIIINTSGTTGKPKSIMLKDESLVRCFSNGVQAFGFQTGDRVLALTNFGHDMAIFDTVGMTFFDGCIIMPDEREMKEPSAWIRLIKTYHVTVWQSVPSFMEMLMLYQGYDKPLPFVRKILHGGEFLTPVLVRKINICFPNAEIFNVGGPTETTVWNIFHQITPEDAASDIIPYGFPMPGTEYHILNSALEECPVAVPGIMYCSGTCLSPGYAGNPAETEKQFPIIHGKRYYHTGDIGIRRPDGELLICGRKDFQVKIHGKRVELSGIESILIQYPGIFSAAVIYEQARLSAIYTADTEIPSSALAAFLRKHLPEHMIPHAYLRIDAIPLTPNGKYDRKALALLLQNQPDQPAHVSPDAGNLREQIFSIITEEIDEEPEEDMNFFEAGGDSLSGVKIAAKVSRLLEKEISVFDLLSAETIGEWLDMILS